MPLPIQHPSDIDSAAPRHRFSIWISVTVSLSLILGAFTFQVFDDRRRVIDDERDQLVSAAARVAQHLRLEGADDADRGYLPLFNHIIALGLTPGRSTTATLVSADGIILTRVPDRDMYVGKDVSQAPALKAHRAGGGNESVHLVDDAPDGGTRLVAVREFPRKRGDSLFIVVTSQLDEALAAWRRRTALIMIQAISIAVGGVALARLAAKREQRLIRSANAANEREELYRGLFRGSKAIKLLIDPVDGRIADANLAACHYYGFNADTLSRMNLADLQVAGPDEVRRELNAAQAEQRDHFYFRHRLASGEIRDVEVHSGPVRYRDRELVYSIIHDVTDRRRLEAERARLVAAIEHSPASIVITDVDGNIQYVNPAFTQVSGYSAAEIIGQNPRVLKSGHTSDQEYQQMWANLTKGYAHSAIFLNKRKDGSLYWEHAQIAPVHGEDGKITSYVGVKENITNLMQVEQDLREANRQLDQQAGQLRAVNAELEQFAYVASHDLRQPLRAISSYLKLLSRRLEGNIDPEVKEFIGYAVDGAQRMDQLIIGLLEYSRIGRLTSPFSSINLGDVLENTLQTYRFAIIDVGAIVSIPDNPPVVHGSPDELQRLFDNLIGNALKYRSPSRPLKITVEWRIDQTECLIWVQDNGIGMNPSDHQRAFGMFQRLVANEQYEGSGIGLAICKKIVEHHHGEIWIDSMPNQGCCFYIRLPNTAVAYESSDSPAISLPAA